MYFPHTLLAFTLVILLCSDHNVFAASEVSASTLNANDLSVRGASAEPESALDSEDGADFIYSRAAFQNPQCSSFKRSLSPRCLSKPKVMDLAKTSSFSSNSMKLSKTPTPSPDAPPKSEQPSYIDGRLWCSENMVRLEHPKGPPLPADFYLCSREVKCWRRKIVRQHLDVENRVWVACRAKCECR